MTTSQPVERPQPLQLMASLRPRLCRRLQMAALLQLPGRQQEGRVAAVTELQELVV